MVLALTITKFLDSIQVPNANARSCDAKMVVDLSTPLGVLVGEKATYSNLLQLVVN